MSKTIATENAPAAIGPYVQGVDLGNMIITSGQIPVNPKTGEVPADVAAQARQSLDNVKAIVEAAGLKVGDIVKTTVFVKDLNDFATVNATYEAFFTEHNATFPARCSSLILMEIRAIMPGLSLMTNAKLPDALRLSGLRDSCNLLNL